MGPTGTLIGPEEALLSRVIFQLPTLAILVGGVVDGMSGEF